jgi:hypothetical protein
VVFWWWEKCCREEAVLTNVGRVLEARGREFLGDKYKDPIASFTDFHKFSIENPEVVEHAKSRPH